METITYMIAFSLNDSNSLSLLHCGTATAASASQSTAFAYQDVAASFCFKSTHWQLPHIILYPDVEGSTSTDVEAYFTQM